MKQNTDITSLIHKHRLEYDETPSIIVSVPGSVRLMGEHIPIADSMLLSFPLSEHMIVAVSARRDSSLRFFAANLNERKRCNTSNLRYKREDRWSNLLKAILADFLGESSSSKGYNITIGGAIPQGLGLGSATALRVAAAKAFALLLGKDDSMQYLASRLVETDLSYLEKTTKLSYYMSTLAFANNSLTYVDSKTLVHKTLPSPFDSLKLVLTDSKVPRANVDGELLQRTDGCALGLDIMSGNSTRSLRDFSISEIDEYMGQIPESIRRYCVFIVEEIQRIKESKNVLSHKDSKMFYKLINKSAAGLRNYYELSCPEIDWLVKRASEIDGVLASRMIGKGFGGCTFTVMEEKALEEYKLRLDEYERIFGFKPIIFEISVGAGMIVQ